MFTKFQKKRVGLEHVVPGKEPPRDPLRMVELIQSIDFKSIGVEELRETLDGYHSRQPLRSSAQDYSARQYGQRAA